jgi:translation initiation factor IF-2
MNNGRVRIYELSRELNLENKDILAVCEQLNISVKSHSSTITEEEAAQIRAAADAPVASTPAAKSTGGQNGGKPAPVPQPAATANNRPILQKKQQILEIRKPSPRPVTSNSESDSPGQTLEPFLASEPTQSPATQSPSNRLNGPPRPVRSDSGSSATQPPPLEQQAADLASAPQRSRTEAQPAAASKSISANDSSISVADRPILKRPKINTPATPVDPADPEASASKEASRPTTADVNRLVERPKIQSLKEQTASAKPEKLEIRELRRPKLVRPGSGAAAGTPGDRAESDALVPPIKPKRPGATPAEGDDKTATSTTTPELKRPNAPRGGAKRGRNWDEETEDSAEFKAAKTTKGKRRVQEINDDDIDLEDIDDLDDLEGDEDQEFGELQAVQATLSIARPPKPKSTTKTAATVKPTSTPPKPKRGGDSESRGRGRRDRREVEEVKRPEVLVLTGSMTVQELATAMALPESTIIKTLFFKGIAANINQALDLATIKMVAEDLEMPVEAAQKESEARKVEILDEIDLENLHRRPPVVTIMGHVDHGKTSLLDAIRKTKVAQGEAGGITQHIGAYHVDVDHAGKTQQVVFLDTPGHEAFTAMRARGARVTDVAILVVAADDGVQPQTIEAISHAKAAKVPIIIAINKIDKESAQPERVKQELTEYDLVPEEWGGSTVMVPVSAITQENLDLLLEMILLVSEVEDLSANPDRLAKGTVIEAHLDKAKGAVATLLIQNGTLRVGDILVAGSVLGKVRAMVDDRGRRVESASPSFAVEVLGLGGVPAAGDDFEVFKDEKEARAIANERTDQQRLSRLQQALSSRRVSLNNLSAKAQEGDLKELNLVLKADVQGSLEAIIGALNQLPQNQVQLRVLFSAPGEISETDVDLAAASDAVIIGFNTTFASGARQAADRVGVDVREYSIIYNLLDDVQGAMEGLLDPELVEEPLGQAEVRAIFPVGKGAVAGCYIQSGKVIRNCKVRIQRGGQVIHEGILDSLKRMREDAREVNFGYECGIGLDSFSSWKEGDIIEAFRMATKRRSLTPA